MSISRAKHWATGAAIFALAASAPLLHAQEVVQALPPAGTQDLNDALQRLARNGDDVEALLDAGDAAITLGDVAAAIGFFGRAQALDDTNPRISLGLARAYTMSRRPVEALRLFAEAERGGIPLSAMAAERGLAFDLVGDAKSAQQLYSLALEAGAGDAVQRNLALSQAISGDKPAFEATLLPLLQQGDNAAFRTRAFGLAILGETDDAIAIARGMMPEPMAAKVEPYLRYMTRLTPAQQAAAGALGVFPRTAAIGRDDADIENYATSQDSAVRTADANLAPAGEPMGSANRRSSSNGAELPPVERRAELPPVRRQEVPQEQVAEVAVRDAPAAVETPAPRENLEDAFADFDLAANGSTSPQAGAVDIRTIDAPRESDAPSEPANPSRHWVQVATGRDLNALGFDWRRIGRNSQGVLAGKSAFTAPWGEANRLLAGPYDTATAAREVVTRLRSVGVDSFPFTSAAGEEIYPLAGGSPAPEVSVPANPARNWVQVATGRDRDALGFDWRRIERRSEGALDGLGPFVASWDQANRLLAGPFDSAAEAREMVNRLKSLGIDTFTFTSEDGEQVDKLD